MTYRKMEFEKLKELLDFALTDTEIQQFFSKSRTALILKGDHAQNAPKNRSDAIRRISQFNDQASTVFASWLEQLECDCDDLTSDQIVSRFRSIEELGVKLTESEMERLCRCGLKELYKVEPNGALLEYMRRDFASEQRPKKPDSPKERETAVSQEVNVERDLLSVEAVEPLLRWFCGVGSVEEISSPILGKLARLLDASKTGDSESLSRLELDPLQTESLRMAIGHIQKSLLEASSQKGIEAHPIVQVQIDHLPDFLGLDVIARRGQWAGNGPYFLDVEAFIDGDRVIYLENEDLQRAVPDEGRVILHLDKGIAPPEINGLGVYRVEEFMTSKPIKVRVTGLGRELLPVIYVPFSSAEPDAIRNFISDLAAGGKVGSGVFLTNDRICLATKSGGIDRVRSPSFDWILSAWSRLQAVDINGQPFVLAPLPTTSRQYDCAPVAIAARRLLKQLSERGELRLTKQQMNDVVEVIMKADVAEDSTRLRTTLLGRLGQLKDFDGAYEALIAELMQSQLIRQRVEADIQLEVSRGSAGIAAQRTELAKLYSEKTRIEKSIAKLKEEGSAKAKEIRTAIQKAFETARDKEAATLGQLALFQSLFSGAGAPVDVRPAIDGGAADKRGELEVEVLRMDPSGEALADVLCSFGFPHSYAKILSAAIEVSSRIGIPVIVTGAGCGVAGLRMARATFRGTIAVVDVPVGLLSESWRKQLGGLGEVRGIVLQSANASDVSLYGRSLIANIAEAIISPTLPPTFQTLIFTGCSGPAALPWPTELEELAMHVNLDKTLDLSGLEDPETVLESLGPLRRKVFQRVLRETESSEDGEGVRKLALKLMGFERDGQTK